MEIASATLRSRQALAIAPRNDNLTSYCLLPTSYLTSRLKANLRAIQDLPIYWLSRCYALWVDLIAQSDRRSRPQRRNAPTSSPLKKRAGVNRSALKICFVFKLEDYSASLTQRTESAKFEPLVDAISYEIDVKPVLYNFTRLPLLNQK